MFVTRHNSLLIKLKWIVLASFLSSPAAMAGNAKPGCQQSCGNLTVDYPFGVGKGCFMQGFEISCNDSYNPPKPFLDFGATKHEIVNISVAENQVRIRNTVIRAEGFNETGAAILNTGSINLTNTPFIFNNTVNKFTVTGCNSFGMLLLRDGEATTGCYSVCDDKREGMTDGSCSGLGCCQTSILKGVKQIETAIQNLLNDSTIKDLYNESEVSTPYHCGYASLIDQESYSFEASDLDHCFSSKIENSWVVLDWVIGDQICEEAKKSSDTYACQGMNSSCLEYESDNGQGYRCSCKQGYGGNPYLTTGCQGQ
ncbi:hypothetical protein REPUB_Repub08aG0040500 [Reevesia pubescens]